MSLSSLWKSQEGELGSKHVQAMVGLAGDGKLRDGGAASKEFQEFLGLIPSEILARYAIECFGAEKFSEAGAVLQDVINEIGRRLGFHPHQKDTVGTYNQGLVVFGCGSADTLVVIPSKEFVSWLERFWTTELEDRLYWHVRIVGDQARLTMDTKAGFEPIDVTRFLV